MRDEPLFLVVALAVFVVTAILMTGLGGFARGGAFNRKYGNKLMQARIIAQAVAIALILFYIWMRGR